MKRITFLAALVAALGACHAQDEIPADAGPAKLDAAAVFAALRPSAVRVEYTPKFDNNSPPPYTERLRDERPLDLMGWVVAPDTVLVGDPGISTRFVGAVAIVLPNGEKVTARQHAVSASRPLLLLKTDAPLSGVTPLAFEPVDPPPQNGFLLNFDKPDTEWVMRLSKADLSETLPFFNARRGAVSRMNKGGLFLAESGAPAGFLLSGEWNSEKPLDLPPFDNAGFVLMDDLAAAEERIAALCGNGIHAATLNFRSPRQTAGEGGRYSRYYSSSDDGDDNSTVQYAIALHLTPGRLLVLRPLNAKQTARLESITLRGKDGGAVPAEFAASLENFGAFIVTSDKLASAPLAVFQGDIRDLNGALALCALITPPGGELIVRHNRSRLGGFRESWKDHIAVSGSGDDSGFVFTPGGELLTLPLARRQKSEESNRWSSRQIHHFNAPAIASLVAEPPAAEVDAANVPLSEREENRIAWLGVEMQPLTAQLAQEMKITQLVGRSDRWSGENGAIITFVHPGSPAEKAGLKIGEVLLRIHAEGRAQPHLVRLDREGYGYSQEFPWAQYDQIPVEYFDRGHIPTPWPPANNAVNQILTSIGFGKTVRVECVAEGGEVREIPLTVEVSPDTYESAPQFEAEALGLHARDLTFEARNYFRRDADAPGVIISRVEPGRHAAVAGMKPFEMIVKVNDAEVRNVGEFEAQIKDRQELSFTVRRMNRERIVRVNLAEAVKAVPGAEVDDE